MERPLLAVDTPSMLFRAFYALPDTIVGPDGKPVNALLGTANLIAARGRSPPAARGGRSASARTRPPTAPSCTPPTTPSARPRCPTSWRPSSPPPATSSRRSGGPWRRSDSLEADDLLGTYARREAEAGGRALLMTGDRDMYQCAGERVTVLYVKTGSKGAEEVGPAEVRERYGIDPELVPDFIALRGDPSDGLPGAKGVGPKTAAELLRKHGSLEGVLDNAIREPRPKLRGALIEAHEDLLAFKDIATLRDAGVERPPRPADRLGGRRRRRPRARHEPPRRAPRQRLAG